MKYKIKMYKPHCHYKEWTWGIYGVNGKHILKCPVNYENRTQCRNVMKKFAKALNMAFKEVVCDRSDHVCKEKRKNDTRD